MAQQTGCRAQWHNSEHSRHVYVSITALGEDGKALGTSQVLGGPQGSTILSVIHHLPKYHVTDSSRCLAEATKITTPRDKGRKKQKEENNRTLKCLHDPQGEEEGDGEQEAEKKAKQPPRNSVSADDVNTSIRRRRLGLGRWLRSKVLATQARGPEFKSPEPPKADVYSKHL